MIFTVYKLIEQISDSVKQEKLMAITKYGGYNMICPDYHGQSLLTIGPDFGKCLIAFVLVNVISAFLLFILAKFQQAHVHMLVHLVVIIYLDIAWTACSIINPGIAIESGQSNQGDFCQKCEPDQIPLKDGRIHCDRCKVCLDGQQHHCTLFGGCVAKNNEVSYWFFLFGMFLWVIDMAATLPYAYYLF